MREILFRGKRIDNGEFVYGYVGVFKGKTQIYVPFTEEEEKENEGHIFSAIGGLWFTVHPETVGQFTGLTDKNGKKIFEGDIVNTYNGTKTLKELEKISYKGISFIGVIKWNLTEARFYLEHLDGIKWHLKNDRFYEIIGNIHDNPELLED